MRIRASRAKKLATYQLSGYGTVEEADNPPPLTATQTATWYYFGSKMIKNASGYVVADRLGSIGHFYPYGLEKPSATTNGTEKFTGYLRDAETGNDYAINRYHLPGTGRFLTPDPKRHGANAMNPGSWNLYAYSLDDPINNVDPSGETCVPSEPGIYAVWIDNGDGQGCSYAGTPVQASGSVFQGNPSFLSISETLIFSSATQDTPLSPLAQTVLSMVGSGFTGSVGVFVVIPVTELQSGNLSSSTEVEPGSVSVVLNWDSGTGGSINQLTETSATVNGIVIGVGSETNGSGSSDLLGFLGLGSSNTEIGLLGSWNSGTFGVFGEVYGVGGGFYFSLGGGEGGGGSSIDTGSDTGSCSFVDTSCGTAGGGSKQ